MGGAVEPEIRQVESATDEAFPQEFDIGQVLEGRVCHRDARQTVLNTFFSSQRALCLRSRLQFYISVYHHRTQSLGLCAGAVEYV